MHELEMKVPWAHCDPYDHLNHAQYLTYFETARIEEYHRPLRRT